MTPPTTSAIKGSQPAAAALARSSAERMPGSWQTVDGTFVNDKVAVAPSLVGGRGVVARVVVEPGEAVECCPVLVVPSDQVPHLDQTLVYGYYYGWKDGAAGIALGYGSLYNHSSTPNADYHKDFGAGTVTVVALEKIAPGEEVLVDYSRGGTNPLWFDPLPTTAARQKVG